MPFSDYSRIVVDYSFPQGVAGAYTPDAADALVVSSGITITPQGSPTIDANGGVWAAVNYGKILACTNVPAKATNIRKYQLWGEVPGTSVVSDGGATILMNTQDNNNEIRVIVQYLTGTSLFNLNILEIVAGVGTVKASATLSAGLGLPTMWDLHVYDQGDALWATLFAWETDSPSEVNSVSMVYYLASRPFQSETEFSIGSRVTPSFAPVRGFRVSDV